MNKSNNFWLGCLCAIGCETLYGFSYMFTKQATNVAGSFELLGWRFLVAFAAIQLFRMMGLVSVQLQGKNLRKMMGIAFCSPVLYFVFETVGIRYTSASESGIILASIPVAVVIASGLVLRVRPSGWQITGIGITLIGVIITVMAAGISARLSPVGYLCLTAGVIMYALYSVQVEPQDTFSEIEITYVMLAEGAAVFVLFALVQAGMNGSFSHLLLLPVRHTSFLTAILYEGIGCSVMAFFLTNLAISKLGGNGMATFVGFSTVVSIFAGVVILGETMTVLQLLGAAIILIGIYVANAGQGKMQ